jgi:hypothetical protein
VVAAVVPLAAGLGVGGWTLLRDAAPVLGQTRTYMSLDAKSGFATVEDYDGEAPTVVLPPIDDTGGRLGAPAIASRRLPHVGPNAVFTEPDGGAVVVDDSAGANVRHIPLGFVSALFRPALTEHVWSLAARLASIENLLWYALYGLALVGIWRCGWAVRRALAFPILFCVLLVGQFSLTQGNLGTAFRHRSQLLWAIALFVALGLQHLRRSPQSPHG